MHAHTHTHTREGVFLAFARAKLLHGMLKHIKINVILYF